MLLSRNKEWVSNQPVKEFYTDSENDMKFYPNSGDMSHFFQSKCRFPWCDLYSENHSNDIHEQLLNCSAWKQSSPPSSLINEMVKTVNPSSSFTNFSMKVDHMDPNSSSLVSGELNLNDIKKSFLCRSKSQSSPPPPPPSSSYSPPLNFSAFTMDQNMLCPLCHKCFRFEKNLLRHLQKTHSTSTGESLLKCKLCNYTTRHYSNMYVHIRTHTG
ncbi:unnamed protein product [Heterobilharzia americana]|nr:unnamed protein product [Heterobilharzia americana]